MTDFYESVLIGTTPVTVDSMKSYLKINQTLDDDLLESMIESATRWGERYTGRDFRAVTYDLKKDCFTDRISLNRDPIDTITSIVYLVDNVGTTVDSSIYYLKKNTQNSEILLLIDQSWPTAIDEREQAITIRFVTKAYKRKDAIIMAIKKHVADWYYNRGDCGDDCGCAAELSGVKSIYGQFRITRVC